MPSFFLVYEATRPQRRDEMLAVRVGGVHFGLIYNSLKEAKQGLERVNKANTSIDKPLPYRHWIVNGLEGVTLPTTMRYLFTATELAEIDKAANRPNTMPKENGNVA